jgi:hypothetical protein
MDIIKCKNCNNEFTGNYCNNCSQASNVDRINLKFIVSEIQKTFIHFDSGFLYTTKKLFVNPGKTILSYLNGARIHHFRSFSFLFFIAGAYLILMNSSHLSMIKESVNGLSKNELNKFIIDYFIQVQFFFIIAYSLFSLVLFHYRHLNFYEFIIMHTYLAGQRILISILLLPLKIWPATAIYDSTINSFALVLGYALMIWAYVKIFSHKNSFLVIIKTMLLQIIIIGVLLFIIKSVFIK